MNIVVTFDNNNTYQDKDKLTMMSDVDADKKHVLTVFGLYCITRRDWISTIIIVYHNLENYMFGRLK